MNNPVRKMLVIAAILCTGTLSGCGGCNDGVEGNTFQAGNGSISIEFGSGGKATFKFMGQSETCTYTQNAMQVSMTCPGDREPTVFNLSDKGVLTPAKMSMMPPLTKK